MTSNKDHPLHKDHPIRIFMVTGSLTLLSLALVWHYMGVSAFFICIVLMLVEITFSFDNAIINARILGKISKFWQTMFMTIGILIAVFGVRFVFPVLLVMITTGRGWSEVIHLAFQDPEQYAHILDEAHPYIAAFGGMFLVMLSLAFFFDTSRKVLWINVVERPLRRIGKWWIYTGIAVMILLITAYLPGNHHTRETLIAGSIGIALSLVLHALTELFTHQQEQAEKQKTHKKALISAGFISFIYLQVLDSSFSLDGVVGAFAVTNDVMLIMVGLGIGALWVRSLTLLMVRRQTLEAYRYLEHGAHYTIAVLATVLLLGLFFDIPEVYAGILGIAIVSSSIWSSIKAQKAQELRKRA